MAYDSLKPSDTGYISQAPTELRTNFEGLKNDQIVNAGTLKGLIPSNSSGQIPISNGNLNTNLNADLLDGQHSSFYATANHIHAVVTTSTDGFMSNADKIKLDSIQSNAEVNQVAFSNVLVGTTTIQADSKTDTLELIAGTNIELTPDATNDRVTIAISGKVASAANADSATTATTCSGNAATATKLQTSRTINGVAFDGSANITITANPNTHTHAGSDITSVVTNATNATTAATCTGNAATATNVAWTGVTGKPTTFTPPIASATILGGVKQGSNISIDGNGVISAIVPTSGNQVSVLSGTISNGGTIPLPSGYTQAQCKFMVSPNTSRTDTSAGNANVNRVYCDVNTSTRIVTCVEQVYNTTDSVWVNRSNCTANYIIIGVK